MTITAIIILNVALSLSVLASIVGMHLHAIATSHRESRLAPVRKAAPLRREWVMRQGVRQPNRRTMATRTQS
jgi:hypothetical protein